MAYSGIGRGVYLHRDMMHPVHKLRILTYMNIKVYTKIDCYSITGINIICCIILLVSLDIGPNMDFAVAIIIKFIPVIISCGIVVTKNTSLLGMTSIKNN